MRFTFNIHKNVQGKVEFLFWKRDKLYKTRKRTMQLTRFLIMNRYSRPTIRTWLPANLTIDSHFLVPCHLWYYFTYTEKIKALTICCWILSLSCWTHSSLPFSYCINRHILFYTDPPAYFAGNRLFNRLFIRSSFSFCICCRYVWFSSGISSFVQKT